MCVGDHQIKVLEDIKQTVINTLKTASSHAVNKKILIVSRMSKMDYQNKVTQVCLQKLVVNYTINYKTSSKTLLNVNFDAERMK